MLLPVMMRRAVREFVMRSFECAAAKCGKNAIAGFAALLAAQTITVHGAIGADETSLKMKNIPYDSTAPAARTFERRQLTGEALSPRYEFSGIPKQLFFAVVSLDNAGERERSNFVLEKLGVTNEQLMSVAAANTNDDKETLRWFRTDYRPILDVTVHCGWRYDPDVDDAYADVHAEVEFNVRSLGRPVESAGPTEMPRELQGAAAEGDGELTNYDDGLPHHFTLAGAKCTATCVPKLNGEEGECNIDILESLAALMTIVQRGNR